MPHEGASVENLTYYGFLIVSLVISIFLIAYVSWKKKHNRGLSKNYSFYVLFAIVLVTPFMRNFLGSINNLISEQFSTEDRWCCQLTDLVYDGVFEVLQWLLFLSAVPPVQLLTGWCVTAKAPPDISAISALTAVKHGNCSSLTPLLNPVRTRKSLIWPWMALDAGQQPALWALASTRFYVT